LPRDAAPDIAALTRATREQAQMAITRPMSAASWSTCAMGSRRSMRRSRKTLRRGGRPVILVGNKADSQVDPYRADEALPSWGGDPVLDFGAPGDRYRRTCSTVSSPGFQRTAPPGPEPAAGEVSVAIIGRPNTGKSSLLNGLVGVERALVSPVAGTTRDVVTPWSRSTVARSASSIPPGSAGEASSPRTSSGTACCDRSAPCSAATSACLVIDASEGASAQDRHIAGYAVEAGAGLVVAVETRGSREARGPG